MKPHSYYSPDGDLVVIHVRPSDRTRTEEHDWGLVVYDAQTGELASIEIWRASSVLPSEVVKALPRLGRSDYVLTRDDLAKPQPA
jgi:uncharacterized protein YuzE